jgi:HlyD family secretion protein
VAGKERKPEDMMQVTSVRSWLLLGSIIAVLASVIVWSVTTQLPERIEGKGVLQTEAGTQQITAAGEGIVHELKLEPGATVEKGQVVGTIRAAAADEASRAAQATYDEARRRHDQQVQAENAVIATLRAELGRKQSVVADKQGQYNRQLDNLKKKVVTQSTVDNAKRELDAARLDVTSTEMAIRNRNQTIATLGSVVEQARINLQRTLGTTKQIAQITSEVTGRVTYVHRRPGDAVYGGQAIADIESSAAGTAVEIIAYVAARNGKRILQGQQARLAVAGVNPNTSGYLRGEVKTVSDYPVSPELAQRMLKEDTVTEASYEVKLAPVAAPGGGYVWLGGSGNDAAVRTGTKVSVFVEVSERRPITLVLPLGRENRVPVAERTGTVKRGTSN